MKVEDLDFEKMNGLIPVVVQEADTMEVLTLAYTNLEALSLTLETGYAHFYRRSKKKVMKKGVTSGNVQYVRRILTDCDHDSLVFLVKKTGPACHKGYNSCFYLMVE